jgi:hypothetical protein
MAVRPVTEEDHRRVAELAVAGDNTHWTERRLIRPLPDYFPTERVAAVVDNEPLRRAENWGVSGLFDRS